ncbi:DUF3482 domain-containing protein [Pseudomonas juntendi]|uniref:DUF3482 domain-containing protein n=1 Tax=Pseudomonas juntendi TaxID=2666183 RepID=UPI002811B6FD|nr:DUF3482 domain-containing protein [Pseudomonas juntendi]
MYESLALLLESARPALQRLIDDQQAQRLARQHSGKRLIAALLLDCAACPRLSRATVSSTVNSRLPLSLPSKRAP